MQVRVPQKMCLKTLGSVLENETKSSLLQEASGASAQKKMGHVIVDLAENAGSGDTRQGLLIQQDTKVTFGECSG